MPMLERLAEQALYVEICYFPEGLLCLDLHSYVWDQMCPNFLSAESRVSLLLGRSDETYLPDFVIPGDSSWGYGSTWTIQPHSERPNWQRLTLPLRAEMNGEAAMSTLSIMVHWLSWKLKDVPASPGRQLVTLDEIGNGPGPGEYSIDCSTRLNFLDGLAWLDQKGYEYIRRIMQNEYTRLTGEVNDRIKVFLRGGDNTFIISPGGSAAGLYGVAMHCSKAQLYRCSNMDSPLHQILTLVGLALLWQGAIYGHF